jgi:hypothetical protein
MSKLIDTLEKVGQSAPSPLGFGGTSRTTSSVPEIMLIGQVAADELINDRSLLDAEVDGVLVVPDSWSKRSLDRIRSALKGKVWGVRANNITESQAVDLKERGCDFIVFEADHTEAAVLNDDELGKIIVVDSELRGREARGIQGLSIDSVLLEQEDKLVPLTVRKLIEIQQSLGRFDKPSLLGTSSEVGAADLEVLRNAGIQGLVVDLAAPDTIAKTRDAISGLPRPRSKSGSRSAAVPRVPASSAAAHEHDEDDQDI